MSSNHAAQKMIERIIMELVVILYVAISQGHWTSWILLLINTFLITLWAYKYSTLKEKGK